MPDFALIIDGAVVAVCKDPGPAAFGDRPGDVVEFDPAAGVRTGQAWDAETLSAPAPTFAELKAAKRAAVIAAGEAAFAGGYTPSAGALAGQTLQVRSVEDRTNWLTSQATYGAAVAAGQGAVEGAMFRTASNQTFMLTFSEGYGVLVQGMAAWGQAIYANLWALKDAVDAAEDAGDLDAIDETAGWP